jgi:hypothetical protein
MAAHGPSAWRAPYRAYVEPSMRKPTIAPAGQTTGLSQRAASGHSVRSR